MTILHAVLLGILEGLTEFLPISSTGHLMVAARVLGLAQTDFLKSFEIAIQSGAIGAVVLLYGRMLVGRREVLKRVLAAFLPTAIIGFVLHHQVKTMLLGNERVVLWAMLLGGVLLIAFERWHRESPSAAGAVSEMTYRQAVLIGVCQTIAMVPGISRSAATILGGLMLGVRRTAIVEFSFLLAVPTMLAATALDLAVSGAGLSNGQIHLLLIGCATSFVVALLSIRWLIRYIRRYNFTPFGIYRILAAVCLWRLVS